MKRYERFSECLKRILEEEGLSASEVSRMVGFRSRNSIFRILSDQSSIKAQEDFLDTLKSQIGLKWPDRHWEDLQEAMVRMDQHDVLFCISFPRYSTRTAEAIRFAREKGTFIIALTDKMDSPIGQLGHVVLLAKSDMASFADSLTAPLSVINALIAAAGVRGGTEVQAHLEELEGVWGRDKVYLTDQTEGL